MEKEVREHIRESYAAGETISNIAKELGYNYRQVYSICHPHKKKVK